MLEGRVLPLTLPRASPMGLRACRFTCQRHMTLSLLHSGLLAQVHLSHCHPVSEASPWLLWHPLWHTPTERPPF